jgi:RND family efflux transporter MFP subunit
MERLAVARAEASSAGAALATSRAAYQRARTLNADNKNVSDRALQEAEARLKGEAARAGAAEETVRLLEGSLRAPAAVPLAVARPGQVVEVLAQPGEAVESGQPLLRVVRFERLLARLEVPAGEAVLPDATTTRILVLGREQQPLRGERVALAAVDAGAPAQAFLFRLQARGLPLRPGLAVTAYLRAPGPRLQGVLVPRSAVVLAEGRSWVYVRTAENVFVRRAVTLERSLAGGWFVPAGLAAGDRVVTDGAQALLSEESRSLAGAGEEGDAH